MYFKVCKHSLKYSTVHSHGSWLYIWLTITPQTFYFQLITPSINVLAYCNNTVYNNTLPYKKGLRTSSVICWNPADRCIKPTWYDCYVIRSMWCSTCKYVDNSNNKTDTWHCIISYQNFYKSHNSDHNVKSENHQYRKIQFFK